MKLHRVNVVGFLCAEKFVLKTEIFILTATKVRDNITELRLRQTRQRTLKNKQQCNPEIPKSFMLFLKTWNRLKIQKNNP